MMKFILLFILFFSSLYSDTVFTEKQELLLSVKEIIQNEESIAKAYEEYILTELKEPVNMSEITTDDYLGSTFSSTFSVPSSNYFKNYIIDRNSINYRLTTTAKSDLSLKNIYESDTYRKKTFFYKDKIYIILKNSFTKNLYTLLTYLGNNGLLECGTSPKKKYCIKDNHIKIYESDNQSNLLMYYQKDMFEKGPIIIHNDVIYHDNVEFKSIPLGALLYDYLNQKYVKTKDDIRKVQ